MAIDLLVFWGLRAVTLSVERGSVVIGSAYVERDSVLDGKAQVERDSVITGKAFVDRLSVTEGKDQIERDGVVTGKAQIERSSVTYGKPHLLVTRRGVLYCVSSKGLERYSVVRSKHTIDRLSVVRSKQLFEVSCVVRAESFAYPVIELETLKFRSSSVYPYPAQLLPLQIVYGDWTADNVCVELQQIDTDLNLWHLSDRPVMEITNLFRSSDGISFEPINSGFETFPNFTDYTGKNIAAVKFKTTQTGNRIFCQCKGVYSGSVLLQNPADIFLDVMENVQGYSVEFLDLTAISRLHVECALNQILSRVVLRDATETVKVFVGRLAVNCNAVHTVNDGAHGMIRRNGVL